MKTKVKTNIKNIKMVGDPSGLPKLLLAVRFAAENKSAASHFHYAMNTESVEIRTD